MRLSLRPFVSVAGPIVSLSICACIVAGTAYAAPDADRTESRAASTATPLLQTVERVAIPGPLRSFLRMAGISQQAPLDQVLPLLARNSYLLGYDETTQTEFLRLVNRYLHQARELQILAGTNGTIHIEGCNDASTLLKVLGYRMRQTCGQKDMLLETANPTRAFLTIDSGFPLIDLEEALQDNKPFNYTYPTTWVPVLFRQSDWLALGSSEKVGFGNVVDILANDRDIAHLYWALAKEDTETSYTLEQLAGLKKLVPYAGTLDFYGSQISIQSGRVALPGGEKAEPAWKELAGANPDNPSEFVVHLLAKDNGWLAAYFDAMSRTSPAQLEHVTQPQRLKSLYDAYRSPGDQVPAARGVLPEGAPLVVLLEQLHWEPNGEIAVPGGLDIWKQILRQEADNKSSRTWAKRVQTSGHATEFLDALVALARNETNEGPLQTYLTLSAIDAARPAQRRLSAETVRFLASRYSQLSSWYLIFSEFPDLSDEAIVRFITVADAVDKIPDQSLRGNAMGAFQANVGLWQILARQGEIPHEAMDSSWRGMVEPFARVGSEVQLFDDAHTSLSSIVSAATGKADVSQDALVELLAGPAQQSADGKQVHEQLADRMRAVMNDQRLVSLDTLFGLSSGLSDMAHGKAANNQLLSLAEELRDFELPRQIFSKSEKVEWAPQTNSGHHAELQTKTDLTKVIREHATRAQLEAARGQLTPLLRDALVGLNYAYYEPPNAQILHINPLFVRSHDFLGITVTGSERLWQAPMLIGAGISAGGGAYLMGSLADLPYMLAMAEQDMISPEHVQALIWKELAPDLLADAVEVRWWGVTPHELHAVALYQKFGEELLTAAPKDAQLRGKVLGILADRMDPQELEQLELALRSPDGTTQFLPRAFPADLFYLGSEYLKRYPQEAEASGRTGSQLGDLTARYPAEVNLARISRDFGVPHPTLAYTNARELLNIKPLPFYGAYSSRLFAERWESGNLYWARLADEMGYSPVMLNRLVPELTRQMISKIFATDLEDWPAVLRAMQETGQEFRQGKIALRPAATTAASIAPMVNSDNAQ